jgi:cell division protein FtsW (lipid II flippase)
VQSAAVLALAVLPGWIGAGSLALQRGDLAPLSALAVLSALSAIAHPWLERVAPARDAYLLPAVAMLTSLGLLSIARTAPNFLARQTFALAIAFAIMLAIATRRDRLRWLRRFKYTWLIAGLTLLLASLAFGVNPAGTGARLWLSIGDFFVQPSELLRLLMIAFLAAYFAERLEIGDRGLANPQPAASHLHSLAPTIAMALIALAMLLTQQDLGAASLLLLTYAFMLYLATGHARLPLGLIGALLLAAGAGYFLSSRVAQRLNIWLNPWADPQGSAFQIVQSLTAVANGGLFGQGINQGRPGYVPAVHTDFPFVMIAEELGLIGALAVLAGFAVVILRAWRVGLRARDRYSLLLAGGIAAGLSVQVFIIVGGNLGMLPITGVTLPFISYGGTSLVVSYAMLGLLIRLSGDVPWPLPGSSRPDNHRAAALAMRASAAMIAALGLASGYWGTLRAAELIARPDNPRLIEAERATFRGVIHARDGTLLAYSSCVGAAQPLAPCPDWPPTPARYERRYAFTEAAPIVGYYSLRYGVGGLEAFADATLRGQRTWLDDALHRPHLGQAITSTIDAAWQRRAFSALHASPALTLPHGAAVVLDWRSGEVLALASAPTFDPNRLDEDWDRLRAAPAAPLVNRATQGLYQPGELLAWLFSLHGADPADLSTWRTTADALGLGARVPFELPNEAVPLPATATYSETIGQGALRVTPLRVAASVASLVAGRPVTPTLIARPFEPSRASPVRNPAPFTGYAQIADNLFVGWHVRVRGNWVIVLALEVPHADHPALRDAIQAIQPDT